MRNLFKKCTLAAAVLATTMFAWGCLPGGWANWTLITGWLNEDLFG